MCGFALKKVDEIIKSLKEWPAVDSVFRYNNTPTGCDYKLIPNNKENQYELYTTQRKCNSLTNKDNEVRASFLKAKPRI